MNVPIHKRRIALLRSIGRPQEAITPLVEFLEFFPADAEGWCELADLYQTQGLSQPAIFCLEEGLLSAPNAWNLHARLGEYEYMAAVSGAESAEETQRHLAQAVHRFSRSIELCDDYLRGYYGLKLTTSKMLQTPSTGKANNNSEIGRQTVEKLDKMAAAKLKDIVSKDSPRKMLAQQQSEVDAARKLLQGKS